MGNSCSFTLDGNVLILPKAIIHLDRAEAIKIINNPETNKKLRIKINDWLLQQSVRMVQTQLSCY
jgi:hypothetical protein